MKSEECKQQLNMFCVYIYFFTPIYKSFVIETVLTKKKLMDYLKLRLISWGKSLEEV